MEIPKEYVEKLNRIAEKSDGTITYKELEEDYISRFNEDYVQNEPSLETDEEKHDFVYNCMTTSYVQRPPSSKQDIIPVGVSSIRKNKDSGLRTANLFILDKSLKLKRMSIVGNLCDALPTISYYNMYKDVNVTLFDSGDLGTDERTTFGKPVNFGMKPKEVIAKLGIKSTTIEDAPENMSSTNAKGYAISTDWRAIKAQIRTQRHSLDDEESEWGSYNLRDSTVDPMERPYVNRKGRKIYPGISAWVSPSLMQYANESMCIFLGPIGKNKKTDEISMSCYSIIPLVVRYIEE